MQNYVEARNSKFAVYNISTPSDFFKPVQYQFQKEIFSEVAKTVDLELLFDPSKFLYVRQNLITQKQSHWDSIGNLLLASYFVDSVLPIIESK
jgi:hypothetical protein